MNNENNYIEKIRIAIQDAEKAGDLKNLSGLSGLSGKKLIGALQRCAEVISREKDSIYLEIGVYQGLTLTSVSAVSGDMMCYGVDNFSQFDINGSNKKIVEDRIKKYSNNNAELINEDFEFALLNIRKYIGRNNIGLYFIDGPHDYRSQYLCLEYAKKYLSQNSVIFIDDSNYEHVRRANYDWLRANEDYALLYDAYTPDHPDNMTKEELKTAMAGWWNGINIIVRDSSNKLERIYPPINTSRDVYYNQHFIIPAKYSDYAPRLLYIFTSSPLLSILRYIKLVFTKESRGNLFNFHNTKSKELPPSRFAKHI
jgi:hypothetical protein